MRAKQVFGHRGYVRAGKMFGFQASEGVAVRTFSGNDAGALYARDGVAPFIYNGTMEMRAWPVLPLQDDAQVADVLTALQEAYSRRDDAAVTPVCAKGSLAEQDRDNGSCCQVADTLRQADAAVYRVPPQGRPQDPRRRR